MTVVVEAEAGREAQGPIRGQVPGHHRRQVLGSVVEAEAVSVTEAAVHFNSGYEIFGAKTATLGRSLQRQRPAGADRVTELPGIAAGQVLDGDGVLGKIPSLEILRQNQFELEFMIVFLARDGVRVGVIRLAIVAFNFLQNLVCTIDLLVLDIEHWIDEVFVLQHAETVLPAETGEQAAVVESTLAVEIDLGGLPGSCAIFELGPVGNLIIAGALRAEGGKVFDFETARFFEVVIVGDDVGTLLRINAGSDEGKPE